MPSVSASEPQTYVELCLPSSRNYLAEGDDFEKDTFTLE